MGEMINGKEECVNVECVVDVNCRKFMVNLYKQLINYGIIFLVYIVKFGE